MDNIELFVFKALGTNHPSLYTKVIFTNHPHWIRQEPESLEHNAVLNCYFRFQHIDPFVKCKIMKTVDGLIIILEKPLRAITPGQYGALYIQNECIGSGRIIDIGPTEDILMVHNENQMEESI